MQTIIAFIATIGSIMGFTGLFWSKSLFLIGGSLSFASLVIYGESFIRGRYKSKKRELADKAESKEQTKILIKNYKVVQILSRIITVIFFAIIFFIFKLNGICWIGIIFGLLFIPELLKIIGKTASGKS